MFRAVVPAELLKFFEYAKQVKYAKGEVITSSEDSKVIGLVKEGYIKRYQITNEGGISIQSIYGPNDVFPITYLFKLLLNRDIYIGPETHYYEAMSAVTILTIEGSVLKDAVAKRPILFRDVFSVSGERFLSNIQRLENQGLPVFYRRVAHQLWFFANKFSEQTTLGVRLAVPLTQQDIADLLGATRETVSLSMTQLKEKGLVKTAGKFLLIPDVENLKEEAFGYK